MMMFRVVHKPSSNHVRCPYRIVEQTTGREIEWIKQYLDYEKLLDKGLFIARAGQEPAVE